MSDPDKYDEKEAQARFEAALRGALKTPAKPLKNKPKTRKEGGKEKGSPIVKESALNRRTARISPRRRRQR
jgi:hypothetical protein